MSNAIYIALSRQTGLFRNLDVAANNVANVNTPGYKGETMVFEQFLANDKDNFNRKIAFSNDVATYVNHQDGVAVPTGRELDLALEGEGFFRIQTPQGIQYTRRGNFTLNRDNELVTTEGYHVLQSDDQVITFQPDDVEIKISSDGTVRVGQDGQQRGQIALSTFSNPQKLKHTNNGLYKATEEEITDAPARMIQGSVEQSNVSPVTELTNLIQINRSVSGVTGFMNDMHELTRRAITAYTRAT